MVFVLYIYLLRETFFSYLMWLSINLSSAVLQMGCKAGLGEGFQVALERLAQLQSSDCYVFSRTYSPNQANCFPAIDKCIDNITTTT